MYVLQIHPRISAVLRLFFIPTPAGNRGNIPITATVHNSSTNV